MTKDDDYVFTGGDGSAQDRFQSNEARRHRQEDAKERALVADMLERTGTTRNRRRARAIRQCMQDIAVSFKAERPADARAWRRPCDERLCPSCSRWRRNGQSARRLDYLRARPGRVYEVLFTQPTRASESARAADSRLREAIYKLRRRAVFKKTVKGWFLRPEMTSTKEGGFHSHAHGLLEVTGDFRPEALEELWRKIVVRRGRVVVTVKLCPRRKISLFLAYMGKPLPIDTPNVAVALNGLARTHHFVHGGTLHSRRFPPSREPSAPGEQRVLSVEELRALALAGDQAAQLALQAVRPTIAKLRAATRRSQDRR